MSVPGLLIALALSLIALAIVARPLLRPGRRERRPESNRREQRDRVESYYERVLTNIRDLDEDYATGKLSEDDYRDEREAWAERGIQLLRMRDQLANAAVDGDEAERIDRAIEESVAAYRARLRSAPREFSEGDGA